MLDTAPQWTQDEAIAFECAIECITDMIGIYIGEIYADTSPTEARQAELRPDWQPSAKIWHVHDHAEIERIRFDYGRRIRAFRTDARISILALPTAREFTS